MPQVSTVIRERAVTGGIESNLFPHRDSDYIAVTKRKIVIKVMMTATLGTPATITTMKRR